MSEETRTEQQIEIDNFADTMRTALKGIAGEMNNMKLKLQGSDVKIHNEVFANLTLCYRHLEDASMRLGKVKQFNNDGESIYDKNVVGSKQN